MENITLMPKNFRLAETARNHWYITVDHGIEFKALLNPDYWAHVARQLTPYSILEVVNEDGTYWGMLIVQECGRNWAKVKQLFYVPLDTKDVAMTRSSAYSIEFKGPIKKFCVIRKADSEILKDGCSKEEANLWLDNYEKAIT